MDSDGKKVWVSISCRPTHGTARIVSMPSVIPQDKAEREVFWSRTLVGLLPAISSDVENVVSNFDDSHGQHDVLIVMRDGAYLGIQVTELTSELTRKREAIRKAYLPKILNSIQKANLHLGQRVVAKLFFVASGPDLAKLAGPDRVAKAIRDSTIGGCPTSIPPGHCRLLVTPIGESDFYVPNVNDIGIDVDFDALPRSIAGYEEAVNCLVEKKANSLSPWLLIWSTDFWRDKHWLGDDVLAHMKLAFSTTSFCNVYFLETLDGEGPFEANLKMHTIKEGTG